MKSRFTEEQFIWVLKEAEAGAGGRERSAQAFAGRCDAGQCGSEGPAVKKMVTPAARREAVAHLQALLDVSERRVCGGYGDSCNNPHTHASRRLSAGTRLAGARVRPVRAGTPGLRTKGPADALRLAPRARNLRRGRDTVRNRYPRKGRLTPVAPLGDMMRDAGETIRRSLAVCTSYAETNPRQFRDFRTCHHSFPP